MNLENLTPTEKLILLSLQLHSSMTLDELMGVTGTGTRKYMLRTLRTLILCGRIESIDNSLTYRLVAL